MTDPDPEVKYNDHIRFIQKLDASGQIGVNKNERARPAGSTLKAERKDRDLRRFRSETDRVENHP